MKIDPATTQLLFADAQQTLVANSATGTPADIDRATQVLVACADILKLPITVSAVNEGEASPSVLPALGKLSTPSDLFVRDCASPFMDPRLVAQLSHHDRRVLVIAGFASEVVIVHAALDALAEGYDVYLPLDAIGSMSSRTEAAIMRQVERAGGNITSVATLATMLAPDFSREPGARVIAAVRGLSN